MKIIWVVCYIIIKITQILLIEIIQFIMENMNYEKHELAPASVQHYANPEIDVLGNKTMNVLY